MINLYQINYPLILDGGLSNVLEDQGCDLRHKLWSAKLIKTNPETIIKAHLSYLEAGADCITTSGYQATVKGFMDLGETMEQAKKLLLKSVEMAEEARDQFLGSANISRKIYIAASMGPYGAFLADGSEYRGDYSISETDLKKFHSDRIRVLASSKADFFAFETIPSLVEINILSELLMNSVKPSWISFSCRDELHLNDGHKISDAIHILANHPTVFAIGVNCTPPKFVSDIIRIIKSIAPGKRIIVYPNSGEVYDAKSKSWQGISDPDLFLDMAREWMEMGADILGGCCRIGPGHIQKIQGLR
jgi:homocysteine S-methyltransferase